MAIAQVQDAQNAAIATTSLTVALGSTATAGNLLVGTCTYRSDRTLANPSGFTTAIDQQTVEVASNSYVDIRIVYKVAAGGEQNIQFGLNTGGFLAAWVGEYSGLEAVSVLDQIAGNGGTGSPVGSLSSGTTPATTQVDELAVAGWGWRLNATGRSYGSSFIEQGSANDGTTVRGAAAHKILSSIGAQESTVVWTSGDTDAVVGAIATFKAAAGAQNIAVSQAIETELGQAITPLLNRRIAVGQANESETANAITPEIARLVTVGQAAETELARAVTPVIGRMVPIGQAVEVEAGQTISPAHGVAVGRVTEVELARLISPVKPILMPVQTAIERELAQVVTPTKVVPGQLGPAVCTILSPSVECETFAL